MMINRWLDRLSRIAKEASAGDSGRRMPPASPGVHPIEDPDSEHAERLVEQGLVLEEQRLHGQAEAKYREALRIYPQGAGIYVHLGNLKFDQQRLDEAREFYERARSVNPQSAGALYSLARVQIARTNMAEACSLLEAAIAIDPKFVPALMSQGWVHERMGDLNRALPRYEQVVALAADHRDALMGLAMAHSKLAHVQEAYDTVIKVLSVAPDDVEGWRLRGQLEASMGFIPDSIASLRTAVRLSPDDPQSLSMLLFHLNYLPSIDPETLFLEHQTYGRRFGGKDTGDANAMTSSPDLDLDPDRRLRVGYVSGDFLFEHPVARFIAPVFANHDLARVEIFAYDNRGLTDALAAKLKAHVHHWRDIASMPDAEVLRLIRNDRIDILVDLSGHTTYSRLGVFADRAAPVQATWLGYLGTTGLATIDYRICDANTDPMGESERRLAERPARMPACQWCLPDLSDLPAVSDLPMLGNGYVTFGSFNNIAKINDLVVEVWADILTEAPEARLIVFGVHAGRARDRLVKLFGQRNICGARVELRPLCDRAAYLRGYGEVDVALDPFPYNGGTTSFDALAMGVPLITLAGKTSISRGGVTVLVNVGLPRLIAHSPQHYVSIAKKLAADPVGLGDLRAGLRNRLWGSPLADIATFTRDLEHLYRGWWHERCQPQCQRLPGA